MLLPAMKVYLGKNLNIQLTYMRPTSYCSVLAMSSAFRSLEQNLFQGDYTRRLATHLFRFCIFKQQIQSLGEMRQLVIMHIKALVLIIFTDFTLTNRIQTQCRQAFNINNHQNKASSALVPLIMTIYSQSGIKCALFNAWISYKISFNFPVPCGS